WRGVDGLEAGVLGVENQSDGGIREDRQAIGFISGVARETKLEVCADALRKDGPVEAADAAFIKPAVFLLITAATLDEHLGPDPEGIARAGIVVGIDENIVVKDAKIAGRMEGDAN